MKTLNTAGSNGTTSLAILVFSISVLVTPVIAYLGYHRYPLFRPEAIALLGAAVVAGLAVALIAFCCGTMLRNAVLAALIVLFADLQFNMAAQILESPGALGLNIHPAIIGLAAAVAGFAVLWAGLMAIGNPATLILAVGFGVALVSTVLIPGDRVMADDIALQARSAPSSDNPVDGPPVVVHLVLDEHQGIGGLPAGLPGASGVAADIRSLYASSGFRLFGNAFSRFADTEYSASHLVNFTSVPVPAAPLVRPRKDFAFGVTRNAYFELMARRGYRIRAYQTPHLDYCGTLAKTIADCRTFPATSIAYIGKIDLPFTQKLGILYGVLAAQSFLLTGVERAMIKLASAFGYPGWTFVPHSVGPLPSFYLLGEIASQVATAQPGTMIYAHLLLPHSPYAFQADCRLRPLNEPWLFIKDPARTGSEVNSEPGYRARYAQAFEQMLCLNRQLQNFFARVRASGRWQETAFILHGDHGSRITRHALTATSVSALDDRDLIDGLATHLAIKFPGVAPGYDKDCRAFQDLIAWVIKGRSLTAENGTVYIHDKRKVGTFVKRQFPCSGLSEPGATLNESPS